MYRQLSAQLAQARRDGSFPDRSGVIRHPVRYMRLRLDAAVEDGPPVRRNWTAAAGMTAMAGALAAGPGAGGRENAGHGCGVAGGGVVRAAAGGSPVKTWGRPVSTAGTPTG